MRRLHVIGAPTSAGAYAPGQERGPEALRAAGLLSALRARGIAVVDQGDVPGFRWRVDPSNPRAMNSDAVATVVRAVADRVARSFADGAAVLVLGGDCTVEVGTVAGALVESDSVGLVYVDLDTDLNTPDTTEDGALDWMGVAHLLGLPGTIPAISEAGPRSPLLSADQVVLFAAGNTTQRSDVSSEIAASRWFGLRRWLQIRLARLARSSRGGPGVSTACWSTLTWMSLTILTCRWPRTFVAIVGSGLRNSWKRSGHSSRRPIGAR
jgi:arginase family enzyme